ncbi:MAG: SusC/RagA family TonB-linked outer membrane protein [Flavobacteriaceae bacterium]|nr:SusC/RagA family TonB-linked outer membrane protein [Flavobacteriaceae bacterium]
MRISKEFLGFMFTFVCSVLWAQTQTITGTVTDSSGNPQSDASITIVGTEEIFYTDPDGVFSIEAEKGQTIQIESLDGETSSFVVGDQTSYNVVVKPNVASLEQDAANAKVIDEVVVTALGMTREKRSLGYSSQQLDASQVNSSATSNVLNNLSGKIAGMDVKVNSNFGGATSIILRGDRSITGSNQALIVIDGVPVNNTNLNSAGSTTIGSTASGGISGYDFGSSGADIDPNNIESVSVLKGAAATALYGSMAANGAIMITTKKGKKDTGLGVSLSSTVAIGTVDKSTFPKYQTEYGQGYNGPVFLQADIDGDGIIDRIAKTDEDASWGPKFDPNLLVYQWDAWAEGNPNYGKATPWVAAENGPITYFETSYSYVNSINLSGGDSKSTYNLTYTNNYETGIEPNSLLRKNVINGNFSRNLSDNFKATAFVNYTNQGVKGRSQNSNTLWREWWAVNVDVQELKDEYFRNRNNVTWNYVNPTTGQLAPQYWNNPYFERYENYTLDGRNRLLTGANLSYDVIPGLNLLGRATIDYSADKIETRKAVGSRVGSWGLNSTPDASGYRLFTQDILNQTYDFIANYDFDITDKAGVKLLGGATFMRRNTNSLSASTSGSLIVVDPKEVYSLNNANIQVSGMQSEIKYEKSGLYAQASFEYDRLWFLEGSIRRDQSTALAPENNTYVYFSVGSSLVFSDLIKAPWLKFGKVRLSYAEVGNDPDPGTKGIVWFNSAIGSSIAAYNSSPYSNWYGLVPERTKSWELGLEATLIKNRISLDFALYKTNTRDLFLDIAQSAATGYDKNFLNAGETENKGIEVSLNLTPIKTANFEWKLIANWSKNENIVIELDKGRENMKLYDFGYNLGSLNATVGQPFGTIRGSGYKYDSNGNRIVNEKGEYIAVDDQIIGNVQPDWMGSISNKFTYKGLSLGFLIDIKKGGDLLSQDQFWGLTNGLYEGSAGLNELGNPVRSSAASGGGVLLPGVKEVVDPNGNIEYVTNDIRVDLEKYNRNLYPSEHWVYDASYVKLREVSLSYSLPEKFLKGTFIKSAIFSAIGNNLWIIHKNLPDSDPEAGGSRGYQAGVTPTTKVYSFNVKLNF